MSLAQTLSSLFIRGLVQLSPRFLFTGFLVFQGLVLIAASVVDPIGFMPGVASLVAAPCMALLERLP